MTTDALQTTTEETTPDGVVVRRSADQVSYDLPPVGVLFGGPFLLVGFIIMAIYAPVPLLLRIAPLVLAVPLVLLDALIRLQRRRIVLTPDRLVVEYRGWPRKGVAKLAIDLDDITSLQHQTFPSSLLVKTGGPPMLIARQSPRVTRFLHEELQSWAKTGSHLLESKTED